MSGEAVRWLIFTFHFTSPSVRLYIKYSTDSRQTDVYFRKISFKFPRKKSGLIHKGAWAWAHPIKTSPHLKASPYEPSLSKSIERDCTCIEIHLI